MHCPQPTNASGFLGLWNHGPSTLALDVVKSEMDRADLTWATHAVFISQ